MKFRLLYLLLIFCSCTGGVAAQQQLCFKKIVGTISEVVYCVFQDSRGYIWAGTDAGVSRYDGYTFTHFTKDDGLTDNDVFQIREDQQGRIWMLTYNGEPTLYDHGRILNSQNTAFLKSIKPGSMATGFIESHDTAWYVTRERVYEFCKDRLTQEIGVDRFFGKRPGFSFLGAAVYEQKPCIITSLGFFLITENRRIDFPENYGLSSVSMKLAIGNQVILATQHDSMLVFDLKNQTKKVIPFNGRDRIITTSYVEEHDFFWIFAEENTYKYFPSNGQLARSEEIMPRSVTYILKDREGNSWLSTLHYGLFFLQNSNVRKLSYTTGIGTSEAYSVTAYEGSIYAGYVNSEIVKITGKQNSFSNGDKMSYRNKVYGFYRDKNGLWSASGNKALLYSRSGKVYSFEGTVKAIASNPDNEIYFAFSLTVGKTAFADLLKKKDILLYGGKQKVYTNSTRINTLLCLNNDTVLLGAVNGLKILVNDSVLVTNPAWQHPVFHAGITRLQAAGGNFIFSTSGKGICLVHKDRFYVIDKTDGLSSNSCNNVFVENDTDIWVATVAGLNKVNYRVHNKKISTSVSTYSVADGLLSDYINDVTVYNDTVWVATDKGLCYFPKNQSRQLFPPPNLNVEELLINGQPAGFTRPLQLRYRQNNVSINFTGISYFSQGKITYRYKLIGSGDEEWKLTTARHVEYASLPPGDYTFLLSAANADMKWAEPDHAIHFIIHPPFWATWWFRLAVLLVLLAVAALLVLLRIRNLKRKHVLQNKALTLEKEKAEFEKENLLYEKQLVELEQQALRLQMNPHFIFNAITAIQGLYSVNDTDKAKKYLVKFSRLLRTLFETATEPAISLEKETALLSDYIELNMIRFGQNIRYAINIDPAINTGQYGITPMLLQPFVENALLHGLAKRSSDGMLLITLTQAGSGSIHCRIEDNGTGRMVTNEDMKNKPHGVSITKKRIDLIGKNSLAATDFAISDLKNPDGTAAGTVISFTTRLIRLF